MFISVITLEMEEYEYDENQDEGKEVLEDGASEVEELRAQVCDTRVTSWILVLILS